MKKKLIYLFLLSFISCQDIREDYYSNGKLKSQAHYLDSKLNGQYKEYFENGNLKIEGNFIKGKKEGSFIYYHPDGKLHVEALYKSDTLYYLKNYHKNGKIKSEGKIYNKHKIDKWYYYDNQEGYITEIQEFFNIRGSAYLNQNWVLNKHGDTLSEGNHYKLISNDTLDFNHARIYFFLKKPYFSLNSELLLCLPQNDKDLKSDFSNEDQIAWDTIDNLAKRFKNQNTYSNRNHDVILDLNYATPGLKRLKGFLLERESVDDSFSNYDLVTRKIYFDKEINLLKN